MSAPTTERYIGLMSGTSLDGVDAVLVEFDGATQAIQVCGHISHTFTPALRRELMALNQAGDNELHRSGLAANDLSRAYARAVQALLEHTRQKPEDIRALGAHGQTVRHRPGEFDGTGYTLQLLNGALLAELSSIDVVCDFRSRDVAAGGQGAPLVPGFHAAVFDQQGLRQAVLNLGGMANLSLLPGNGRVLGFDCGPGNVLLDLWTEQHLGQAYDANGTWAAGGKVDQALLARLLGESFFSRPPPKSTGRDLFNADWLAAQLTPSVQQPERLPRDIQATLAELTVQTVTDALNHHQPGTQRLLVCGGGALNAFLMQRLVALLPNTQVQPTTSLGLPPLVVEAAAFAWLAKACLNRRASNCPGVTGARGHRILGAMYAGN